MNYIYIDANIYLRFYIKKNLKKLLDFLVDNDKLIIATTQIKNEVFRNSVHKSTKQLKNIFDQIEWSKPSLPYLSPDDGTLEIIDNTNEQIQEMKNAVRKDIERHLTEVTEQQDEVSILLNKIFNIALVAKDEEIEKAEKLKKFGNPPGKYNDPIGDELSWTQVLGHLNENDTLIIVTNDRDYGTLFEKKLYLNSYLHKQLADINVDYFLFNDITPAITKLKDLQANNIELENYPSEEESEELLKEEHESVKESCTHKHVARRQNGIFIEYFCEDCNSVLAREYFGID